jgi:chromosome partitioning protein
MSSKTISIATHKGGTGKTVTTMALGAAFVQAGQRCLLVDLDPQGHSTLGLGVEIGIDEPTLRDFFSEPSVPLSQIIRETTVPCLHIVPSTIRLARVAQALYMRPRREELLKRGLEPVYGHYDVIVIDCPPSLGVLTETAIAAADLIIIPCMMEARAADGLVDLLEVMRIIKGDAFDNWRILLTKVDPRKSMTNQAVMEQLSPWKGKMLKTAIPQSEPLNQAQIARTDIFSFEPKSKGALAYTALTKEVLQWYRRRNT